MWVNYSWHETKEHQNLSQWPDDPISGLQFAEKDGQLLEERIRKSAKNRPVASVKPMSIKSEEPEEPAEPEEEYQEEDHHERTPPYHSSPSVNSTPPQSNATINVKSPSMIDRHVSAYSPR